jgi:hypothetical protein
MTRRISLIIGIAVIALTVAVPAAFGQGRYGGSQEPADFWNYESRAKIADSSPGIAPDDLAKLYAGAGRGIETNIKAASPDLVELLMAKNGTVDGSLLDALTANSGSAEISTVGSGTEIEWSNVGVGLGLGFLLALGLGFAMRIAHVRPFAH